MPRRRAIERDHADADRLAEAGAHLRRETNQARYTNRHLDPYPLYVLAAVLDAGARLVRQGGLEHRSELRAELLRLADQIRRPVSPPNTSPGLGSPTS